MYIGIYATII
jgi:hypothetical protein